jgi:hypothetical protein
LLRSLGLLPRKQSALDLNRKRQKDLQKRLARQKLQLLNSLESRRKNVRSKSCLNRKKKLP